MLDKSGFDKWAGSYDENMKAHLDTFPFEGYYEVLAAVVSLVNPGKGMTVLDIGIGTGLLAEELNSRGCIIHGVDFSGKMLEKAKLRIPSGLYDIVDVSKDHFGRFSGYEYDRVVSSYAFHHFNLQQKTKIIKRTLKQNLSPNGKMIIADVGFGKESDFQTARKKYQTEWDNEEFYMCGDSIVAHLQSEEIKAGYNQISNCAGILVCRA